MKDGRAIFIALVCTLLFGGSVSCSKNHHSAFAEQAIKPADLVKVKYRPPKNAAVGESMGFKFLWIPFATPSEAEAKRDMLERLQKEGINTSGKHIAYTNATSDRGGFGFIGLIGAPTITLTSDVVEILGEAPPQADTQSVRQ